MSQRDNTGLNLGDLGQDEDPIKQAIQQSIAGANGSGDAGAPPPLAGGGSGGAPPAPAVLTEMGGGGGGMPSPMAAAGGGGDPTKNLFDNAPAAGGPPAAPDYTKRGSFGTFNGSSDKYNKPWDQLSERYKMQTVLSNFDPSKGITPEVLDALNKADIKGAKFSGSGDKLDARGLNQWEGYDGREGVGDIIQGFNDPNNKNKTWGAWAPEDAGPGGGGAHAAHDPIAAAHSQNPLMMNQALGSSDFFQKLMAMAQQKAGPASTDQNALLSLMNGQ